MTLQSILKLSPELAIPYLLGATITTNIDGIETSGILTELEAYLAFNDKAAHNSRGQTKVNNSLYKDAGTLYMHSMRQHILMDIVTENIGIPSSILVRSIQPLDGINTMMQRRQEFEIKKLTNGPGKVCRALGLNRSYGGINIFKSNSPVTIKLADTKIDEKQIKISKRIGLTKNIDIPLRFELVQ